ncbi:MAG: tryptophan synthase subunit alpha [Deltaproteobacteria bacterium]|nr:tryptophan synthase subunit alpha [Deltaproteobacteria bacterium]
MLESYIRSRRQEKDILLMTHIVLGYPDFETSLALVETMVQAGVDLMELQIPFSEPIADGPVIARACQKALERGVTVRRCLEAAHEAAANNDIPFLFMSYFNILFKYGTDAFVQRAREAGIKGAIVPDVPPEEGDEYLTAMTAHGLDPIFIFAPTSTDDRMKIVARHARGFVYCVARKGVTGEKTEFSRDLDGYLARCRRATELPLALGFGVSSPEDVDALRGRVDIAVVGSQAIRVLEDKGAAAVGEFIAGLRK